MEVARKREEAGITKPIISVPASSKACVECHEKSTPGIIAHWMGSTHARKGVSCVECHHAEQGDADRFEHYGESIATVVTPRDCGRCHTIEAEQFAASHHSKAGNILASLDNLLAETAEGSRTPFDPHSPTPGFKVPVVKVNGMASANTGCRQCHGAKTGLDATDGSIITVDDLKPGPDGKPTNTGILTKIARDSNGKPHFAASTWPNTGIGRINLDGSISVREVAHVPTRQRKRTSIMPSAPSSGHTSATIARSLVPGMTIAGRFRVGRRIAAGGMGEVWEGVHTELRLRVALKTLRRDVCNDHEVVARFSREAFLMGRVQSDHVARVLDFVVDKKIGPILVMELIEGVSLASLLDSKRLTIEEAIELGMSLATGLRELHRARVVHRDVKPANIILRPSSEGGHRPVFVDLGVGRMVSDGERRSNAR